MQSTDQCTAVGYSQKLKLLMFNVEVYNNNTSSPPPPRFSLSLSLRHNEASAGERDNTCKERKALKYKQVIQMSMHARKALKVFFLLLERLTSQVMCIPYIQHRIHTFKSSTFANNWLS